LVAANGGQSNTWSNNELEIEENKYCQETNISSDGKFTLTVPLTFRYDNSYGTSFKYEISAPKITMYLIENETRELKIWGQKIYPMEKIISFKKSPKQYDGRINPLLSEIDPNNGGDLVVIFNI
jgi:hypothetical protein